MIVDLASYDVILVNSSAGKDSQASLDVVVEQADALGVRDRIVVVHVDLGRVEWKGTRQLAEEQAEHYGLRFIVVSRDRDLLHQLEFERKKWPGAQQRWCTSDQKTGVVAKVVTRLAAEVRDAGGPKVPRILQVLGIRAQESPKRAKMEPFGPDKVTSSRRTVDRWYPIHDWSVEQVWDRIRASGVRSHPAYAKVPRLSCVLCVFASREALLIGARANPELAAEYARIEIAIGHQFRQNLSIAEIAAEALAMTNDTIVAPDWAA